MRRPPTPHPEVVHTWDCLVASDDAIGVRDLADEVGWSRRHLTERFRAELGLAPKVMGRVLRFERSRNLIGVRAARDRDAVRTLADVAAVCGYYDQAHMTRDWNELAGCTPSVWMAEELHPSRPRWWQTRDDEGMSNDDTATTPTEHREISMVWPCLRYDGHAGGHRLPEEGLRLRRHDRGAW